MVLYVKVEAFLVQSCKSHNHAAPLLSTVIIWRVKHDYILYSTAVMHLHTPVNQTILYSMGQVFSVKDLQ